MSGEYFCTGNSNGVSAHCSSGSPACTSSRWITEEVFKLIDMVQRDEAIYNPRHKYYFCRPYVENFWREVDIKLEKNPGASLAKWTNLRISFRREYTNYLEEKIPPCWTYFDRMFFLHPYLRKKQHTSSKMLDSQVQDALAHISTLSNRIQRERCLATSANAHSSTETSVNAAQQLQHLDTYFEYFDETEQNNSELEDIIDDDQQTRFRLPNDIKSECEDTVDDFELEQTVGNEAMPKAKDNEMHADEEDTVCMNTDKTRQQQLRLQQMNRLQTRSYHDEWRAKRPCSQESVNIPNRSSNHSNVSLVRPTISKSTVLDTNCTTTSAAASVLTHNHTLQHHDDNKTSLPTNMSTQHMRHHHHRLDMSSNNSLATAANSSHNTSSTANAVELCDCKSDPDAMFLMSLLPDIQKLNGRDRGKIKIAFQNILQDYLYPD